MPTPINDIIELIADAWVATVPPDETSRRYYHAALEAAVPDEQSAHRSFWFEVPARGEPVLETDVGVVVPYELVAFLVLDSDGRTPATEREALLDEASLLMRTVDLIADNAWPAGTVSPVITGAVDFKRGNAGGYVVELSFSVEVEET